MWVVMTVRPCDDLSGGVNLEMVAFLTFEDSLQLATGNLQCLLRKRYHNAPYGATNLACWLERDGAHLVIRTPRLGEGLI